MQVAVAVEWNVKPNEVEHPRTGQKRFPFLSLTDTESSAEQRPRGDCCCRIPKPSVTFEELRMSGIDLEVWME